MKFPGESHGPDHRVDGEHFHRETKIKGVDMANEGLITEEEAVARVDPSALDQLLHPTLDPKAPRDVLTKGLPASPGAASGQIVFDADSAERFNEMGEAVIKLDPKTHFPISRAMTGHLDNGDMHVTETYHLTRMKK